jgi:hypothetical protein
VREGGALRLAKGGVARRAETPSGPGSEASSTRPAVFGWFAHKRQLNCHLKYNTKCYNMMLWGDSVRYSKPAEYQKLAQIYLSLTEAGITKALNEGELQEVI